MIKDGQAQEILKAMKAGFKRVDKRFDGVERRFSGLEKQVGGLKKEVGGLKQQVGGLTEQMGSVIVELASHGEILKTLVTKDEFVFFKDQNLSLLDGLVGQIADLQEAEALRLAA